MALTGNLAFIGVNDLAAARNFYEDTLNLPFIADEQGTLVFDMLGTPLRISTIENFTPQSFSVLGWVVDDIATETTRLIDAGVEPVRFPGMPQDANGIANLGGVRILWFKDPAGNLLSFTQN